MTIISRLKYPKIAIGVSALIAAATSSFANLNYDLRVTAKNGVSVDPALAKGAGLTFAANDLITFTAYAQVTGATAGAGAVEGYQSGLFSILSSTTAGQTQGFFVSGTVLPTFATGAFNGGTPTDTNADGINDRLGGQRNSSAQAAAPFDISVRSGSTPLYTGTPITDGQEFALATADFRITLLGGSGSVNIAPSIFTSGIGTARFSATWAEDTAGGTASANRSSGFNGLTPAANVANTGTITVGSPINLVLVPEPSAFGMILLGTLGLIGMRRSRFQRAF